MSNDHLFPKKQFRTSPPGCTSIAEPSDNDPDNDGLQLDANVCRMETEQSDSQEVLYGLMSGVVGTADVFVQKIETGNDQIDGPSFFVMFTLKRIGPNPARHVDQVALSKFGLQQITLLIVKTHH